VVRVERLPDIGWQLLMHLQVFDNKRLVGKLGPGKSLTWFRDPGPMTIELVSTIGGAVKLMRGATAGKTELGLVTTTPSLTTTTEAGQSYGYSLVTWGEGAAQAVVMKGPGSLKDAFVLFRVTHPVKKSGLLRTATLEIANVSTGKSIKILSLIPGKANPVSWFTAYLPPGQYYVSSYKIDEELVLESRSSEAKINGEFSVSAAHVGVYLGDLTFGNELRVSQDVPAARKFLSEIGSDLALTESALILNK
jgi:hypothetical protein